MPMRAMPSAGLVLAAGASSRMGQPKALLRLPDGRPLARTQVDLLSAAGCDPVILVVGKDADPIAAAMPGSRLVNNPEWASGRFSSVRAGLRSIPGTAPGCIVLPVDTVGVRGETIRAMLGRTEGAQAVRPYFRGAPGRVIWLSRALVDALLALDVAELRIDEWLKPRESAFATPDDAVVNNFNTPAEWTGWLNKLGIRRAG